eukprot:6197565-Pleurochrysis_carterae.AAC.1
MMYKSATCLCNLQSYTLCYFIRSSSSYYNVHAGCDLKRMLLSCSDVPQGSSASDQLHTQKNSLALLYTVIRQAAWDFQKEQNHPSTSSYSFCLDYFLTLILTTPQRKAYVRALLHHCHGSQAFMTAYSRWLLRYAEGAMASRLPATSNLSLWRAHRLRPSSRWTTLICIF